MTPGARLQTLIDLLTLVLTKKGPADQIISTYFRQHRFIGAADRRDIGAHLYHIIRNQGVLLWLREKSTSSLKSNPSLSSIARELVLLSSLDSQTISDMEALFKGEKYTPTRLNSKEIAMLTAAQEVRKVDIPMSARLNIPDWILQILQTVFGDTVEKEMEALNQPAPLDLRINPLKTTRLAALALLKEDGSTALETPWSPLGIRLRHRLSLPQHPLWQEGWVEVQDEGSQLIGLLADAQPGMQILDLCAGAGGKSLIMGACMKNTGRIVATDILPWRLQKSRTRLKRAGLHNVECRLLDDQGSRWLSHQTNHFDRVLVDAPCSGSGTWRRNPDLKWHFTLTDLEELTLKQEALLQQAAPLVKKGGRLIYATCSLFPQENQAQINTLLDKYPSFQLMPIASLWPQILTTPCPTVTAMLHLTPAQHQVDGFFCAVLERK